MLEKFFNDKRSNFIMNLKVNQENNDRKIFNTKSNNNKNTIIANCGNRNNNINEEFMSKITSLGRKSFSGSLASINNKKGKFASLASAAAPSLRNKINANPVVKPTRYRRKSSHDNFFVKNNYEKVFIYNKKKNDFLNKISDKNNENNKLMIITNTCSDNKFDELHYYFYSSKNTINFKNIAFSEIKKKNYYGYYDFDIKINNTRSEINSNEMDVTRKISGVLYNLIANDDHVYNEKQPNIEAASKSECNNNFKINIDSKDVIANFINSDKKSNSAYVIGPTPNIREIKKNFAFNKSFDSFDVQSEFLITYLRDDDFVSEISQSGRNTETNKAVEENDIKTNKKDDNRIINNNKSNNKNFQEKVFLNINNKYSKTLNNNIKNNNNCKNKNKNINLNEIENKKQETVESSNNNENNKYNKDINNNKNCGGFFKCRTNPSNNNNINNINNNVLNINSKTKKGKKQDAVNINSYYSTINNTKRSTNHSFKSIRLNDSLTKFRKRRLSNCTTDINGKCPTKGFNCNLETNLVKENDTNTKNKKINCRCEIF